jgi:protein TonB
MSFDRRQRPLFAALCLSVLLHLLVLLGGGLARPPPVGGNAGGDVPKVPFQAQIRSALSAAREVAPAWSEALPVRSSTTNAGRGKRAPTRQHVIAASDSAMPVAAAASAASGSAAASAADPAAAASPVGVSADGLRQYRIDLAGAARRYRSYPALARSRGWQGVVELSVLIGPSGGAVVQLNRSSGYGLLDEQAQDMMSRAVAQTPLPESLRGGGFSVAIPIRFSLED